MYGCGWYHTVLWCALIWFDLVVAKWNWITWYVIIRAAIRSVTLTCWIRRLQKSHTSQCISVDKQIHKQHSYTNTQTERLIIISAIINFSLFRQIKKQSHSTQITWMKNDQTQIFIHHFSFYCMFAMFTCLQVQVSSSLCRFTHSLTHSFTHSISVNLWFLYHLFSSTSIRYMSLSSHYNIVIL